MGAVSDLKRFVDRLKQSLNVAISRNELRAIGEEANRILVRRTRLGFGVLGDGRQRKSLRAMRRHSPIYARWRKLNANKLSDLTAPSKHNLTLTGQLLESQSVLVASKGRVVVGPKGRRRDGFNNPDLADRLAALGWHYNNLSSADQKQVVRFYRLKFGDLVRRRIR